MKTELNQNSASDKISDGQTANARFGVSTGEGGGQPTASIHPCSNCPAQNECRDCCFGQALGLEPATPAPTLPEIDEHEPNPLEFAGLLECGSSGLAASSLPS